MHYFQAFNLQRKYQRSFWVDFLRAGRTIDSNRYNTFAKHSIILREREINKAATSMAHKRTLQFDFKGFETRHNGISFTNILRCVKCR